ncbi:hypothetical protein D3C80_1759280 [compost metagenome]
MLQHHFIVYAGAVVDVSQAVRRRFVTHGEKGVNMALFKAQGVVANRQAKRRCSLIQQNIQP